MRAGSLLVLLVAALGCGAAGARPALRTPLLADDKLASWSRLAAWRELASRGGGAWSVRVDARTGRPAVAWGRGIELPGIGESSTLAQVEDAVRREVLQRHRDLFGVDPALLRLDETASGSALQGRLWSLDFVPVPDGVRIEGARVGVRILSGRVVEVGTVLLSDLGRPGAPAITAEAALAVAARAAGIPSPLPLSSELVLVPQLDDPAALRHRLAWHERFRAPSGLPTWEARVDATSGEILSLQDASSSACDPALPRRGIVQGGVLPESPLDAEVPRAFAFARVESSTGSQSASASGLFADDAGGATSRLDGSFVATRCSGCSSPATALARADGSSLVDFGMGGTGTTGNGASTRAERNAWYHASRARAIAAAVVDPSGTPWLSEPVVAEVNLASTCTALWNGERLLLSRAGGGCANAAEVAGLVAHEWTHGLVEATGSGSDRALGEAFGDLVAMLDWRRPDIASGWLPSGALRCLDWRACAEAPGPPGTPLTRATVAALCPPGGGPEGGEIHCEGQVLGQAGWDLLLELRGRHPEWGAWHEAERLILASMLSSDTYVPDDIGGAYWAFVLADDDDADLSDGTPHGAEIWRAFDLHGIAPAACGSHAGCVLPNVSSAACPAPGPALFSAAAVLSPTDGLPAVELSWPPDPAAASWNVWRSDFADHDAFVLVASGLTSPGFLDETPVNGTSVWHAVQALGPGGCESLDVTPRRTDVDVPALRLVWATVSDAAFGDGDGVPEPGERLEILARVAHAGGPGARTTVTGELISSDPSSVTVATSLVSFPDVLPASEADALQPFVVDVPAGAARCGLRVPLTVVLTSDGDCRLAGFALTIGAGGGDVAISGATILDSATNANGHADAGESAPLLLAVTALGPGGLTNASVTLSSADPLVAASGTSPLPPAPSGGTSFMTVPLSLTVDPLHACPGEARLIARIVADEGCWTREVVLPVGDSRIVFEDGFDRDLGWSWRAPGDDADRGAFTRGISNPVDDGRAWQPGGRTCALTGNETASGDPEAGDLDGRTTLTSPGVDLTGETRVTISWSSWLATSSPGSGDALRLLVRDASGAWIEAWREEADAASWTPHALRLDAILPAPLGPTALRFEATGDLAHVVEAAVDDVVVRAESCDAPGPRADVTLDSLLIDDGRGLGHGNGDSVPDPGESLVLAPSLISAGNAAALNVRVSLRLVAPPPGVVAVGMEATVPDLAPRDIVSTDWPHLRIRLLPSIACGTEIHAELVASFDDEAGVPHARALGPVRLVVGTLSPAPCDPFSDPGCGLPVERIGAFYGFEGPGDDGWSHGIEREPGVTSASARDDWQRGAPAGLADDPPAAWEGSRAFGTDLGLDPGDDGLHDASARTYLQSPAWDASRFTHVRLRYARWLGAQDSAHDVARLTVSGEEVWRNAPSGPLASSCEDVSGLPATHASDSADMPEGPAGWKLVELDVTAQADHHDGVTARWEMLSDGACEHGGWTIDAVELWGARDLAACRPHAPCDASFLRIDGGPDSRLGCNGTAPLAASVLVADGPWGADVDWTPVAGVADPHALLTTTSQPGVYVVTITDRTTGCSRTDTVLVTDFRVPPDVRAGNDGPVTCAAPVARLTAQASGGDGSLGYAYSWSPAAGLGDPNAAVTTATLQATYTCTVTDLATGCTATDSTTLARDASPPIVDAGPDLTSACFAAVTLQGAASGGNGTAGYAFAWTPSVDLDDASIATPSTNVPGDYTLTVTDLANGCTAADTVTVRDAGDRLPPTPVGDTLRVTRSGGDVVLDVSRHAGAATYRAYRSALARDVPETGLDGGSPFLRFERPGPLLSDAGAAAAGAPLLLFYRVQSVSSCGVEE